MERVIKALGFERALAFGFEVEDAADPLDHQLFLERFDEIIAHAQFGDRGLFTRNVSEPRAEELLVVECQVGDATYDRALDHSGCIKPAAEAA